MPDPLIREGRAFLYLAMVRMAVASSEDGRRQPSAGWLAIKSRTH